VNSENDRLYLRAFYGLLLFHGLIWFSLGMALDLHPDTADHWVWSRFLSWGYYEHPPMIAWVIRLFTAVMGNNQWALEIGTQTVGLFSLFFLFKLARMQFGTPAAFWSTLTLEATPIFSVGSIIFVIDSIMILFYLWTALLFWKGFHSEKKHFFYWAGLTLGLALLSKVTAVLFPLTGFIFCIVDKKRRKWLLEPGLYLGLLLGLIIFSPFLYWNSTQDWISFKGQLGKGLTGGRDWNQVLGFWLGQPLILGPILFIIFLTTLINSIKKVLYDDRYAYLVFLTGIPLIVFGLASFKGKYTDPSWTVVGWPFGAILVGRLVSDWFSRVSFKKGVLVVGLIFLIGWLPLGLLTVQAFSPFLNLGNLGDRTQEMRGWRELGEGVGKEYRHYFPDQKKVYVIADDYQVAGAVSFYTPQHPIPYSYGKSKRNIWVTLEELKKNGALLVCSLEFCGRDQEKTKGLFNKVEQVSEIPILRQGQVMKKFKVFYCSN
jgi:4-amino-4-deoxy-L-arabinose transferase-like glycosyltransferase